MELQFSKNTFPYLRRAVWEVKNEEQTQEVKLTDSLPDIGRILGAWGQPLIRSKEWRGNSMAASGGVMAWILYAPEEGPPQCVETWIPFQTQWEFAQVQHDGTIRLSCLLKGIDARSVSARKMMVRALLSIAGEALEPTQAELYQPVEVPTDVQLLRKNYPVCLPTEAGEKTMTLDEELTPPASCGQIRRIIRCNLQPEMADQRIMADKVVFRGSARVRMLCLCEDEQLQSCEFELPFSQYAELEKEYDPNAASDVIPAVTNLEVDIQENGNLRLKAGLVGQYVIYDRPVLEVVTDAYSNQRTVSLQQQQLELPAVLELRQEVMRGETELEDTQLLDTTMLMSHPTCSRKQEGFLLHIPGSFQYLGYDSGQNLSGGNLRWEKEWELPADERGTLLARSSHKGKNQNGLSGEFAVDMLVTASTDIPMVTALELGEAIKPDAGRPSLILRRAGKDSLWEIAKRCGSTVDAIQEANALTEEPREDRVLLIPVS